MHQVKLSALELTVELEDNQRIVDHGPVGDMVEHTRQLLRERNMPQDDDYIRRVVGLKEYWWNPICKGGGNYIGGTFGEVTTMHIRYISSGDDDKDLYIRAHEETHVLEDYGHLDAVRTEIIRVFGKDIELTRYHGETIANIGGILALKKNGKSNGYIGEVVFSMNITNGEQYKREALDVLGIS